MSVAGLKKQFHKASQGLGLIAVVLPLPAVFTGLVRGWHQAPALSKRQCDEETQNTHVNKPS